MNRYLLFVFFKPVTLLYISVFALFISACGESKTVTETQPIPDSAIVVSGKIISENFVNKAGKEYEWKEYYLVYNGETRFIKISDSQIKPDELASIEGKTLQFRILEKTGLWDTNDPNAQSRIGDYVAVIEIVSR